MTTETTGIEAGTALAGRAEFALLDDSQTEFFNKRYTINMPDNSTWAVPIWAIAKHRANNYKAEFNGSLSESLAKDTLPLFMEDEYSIYDWAANNLNWDDVRTVAECIKQPEVDYQAGWCDGDYDVI